MARFETHVPPRLTEPATLRLALDVRPDPDRSLRLLIDRDHRPPSATIACHARLATLDSTAESGSTEIKTARSARRGCGPCPRSLALAAGRSSPRNEASAFKQAEPTLATAAISVLKAQVEAAQPRQLHGQDGSAAHHPCQCSSRDRGRHVGADSLAVDT